MSGRPARGRPFPWSFRPTRCRSHPTGVPGENSLRAVLSGREFTGSQVIYYLETAGGGEVKMVAQEPFSQTERAAINMAMQLYWSPADTVVLRPEHRAGRREHAGPPLVRGAGNLIVVAADVTRSVAADMPAAAGSGLSPMKVVGIGIPLPIRSPSSPRRWSSWSCSASGWSRTSRSFPAFSLENYLDIAQHMFAKSNYALAIAQSLWVSLSTAFFAVLVCYPMVLAIVYVAPRSRHRLLLMLAVAPFWSSYVLRLFSWQILLANKGIINSGAARWAGFENLQFNLLYTQIATRIGLIHYLAPILIVVLYVTVANIDRDADRGRARSRRHPLAGLPPRHPADEPHRLCWSAPASPPSSSFGDVLSGALLGGGVGNSLLGSVPLFSNMIMSEYASSTNLPRTCGAGDDPGAGHGPDAGRRRGARRARQGRRGLRWQRS